MAGIDGLRAYTRACRWGQMITTSTSRIIGYFMDILMLQSFSLKNPELL